MACKYSLPGLELDLDDLGADLLGERHAVGAVTLVESEATLAEERLNVLQLLVVVVLVLDVVIFSVSILC